MKDAQELTNQATTRIFLSHARRNHHNYNTKPNIKMESRNSDKKDNGGNNYINHDNDKEKDDKSPRQQ